MKYQTFTFRKVLTLVLLTFLTVNLSATTAEKTVKTAIKDVTVFLKGAQINRTASVAVPAGKSVLKLNPTEKSDVNLIYSVKYPKNRSLIVE